MTPGQTVLDRFTLVQALPAVGELSRWSATDPATGGPVGISPLPAAAALRPGAADRFQRAWARPVPHPALLAPLVLGAIEGRPVAAHEAVHPIDPELRLGPGPLREWAAWLGPAALAAEQALGGELGPADLVVDAQGVLRLAPSGLSPARPELSPPFHRAPELRDGGSVVAGSVVPGSVVPGSALYGLGVLLFRAATGAWPVPARTAAALAAAGPPRRAHDLDPSLPADVDALLAGLLDPVPARRIAALESLPPPAPVQVPDALKAPAVSRAPTALTTTALTAASPTRDASNAPTSLSRPDLPRSPWVVAAAGRELTAAARTRAAALLDLPDPVVERAAAAGAWLPLEGADSRASAEARAAFLAQQGLPAVARSGAGPGPAWAGAFAAAVGAVVLALAALISAPLSLLLAAALGILALPLAAVAVRQIQAARQRGALDDSRRLLVAPPASGPVGTLQAELRAARRALLAADLAPAVRLHLEEAAAHVAERLQHLPASPGPELLTGLRASIRELRAAIDDQVQSQAPQGAADADARAQAHVAAARAAARELGP